MWQDASDADIDEMISMIDKDGDGGGRNLLHVSHSSRRQVDFFEFRRMALRDLMGLSSSEFAEKAAPKQPPSHEAPPPPSSLTDIVDGIELADPSQTQRAREEKVRSLLGVLSRR